MFKHVLHVAVSGTVCHWYFKLDDGSNAARTKATMLCLGRSNCKVVIGFDFALQSAYIADWFDLLRLPVGGGRPQRLDSAALCCVSRRGLHSRVNLAFTERHRTVRCSACSNALTMCLSLCTSTLIVTGSLRYVNTADC